MVRQILIISIFLYAKTVFGQSDTIVVRDYTKVFVTTQGEKLKPVTDFSEVDKVGFFLNKVPRGMMRICNDEKITGWSNGRLIFNQAGCELIDPSIFFKYTSRDTVFVSLSSTKFVNLICEQIIFETYQVVKDQEPSARRVRDSFREFNIIVIPFLIFCFALFSVSFPSRIAHFASKTYSLKLSVYQFINTGFFGRANTFMMLIICLCISYEIIYIRYQSSFSSIKDQGSLAEYFSDWLTISFWLIIIFFAKRFLVQLVAGLFKMRKLKDWQLFDLINFLGHFSLILFIIILWDFILKSSYNSWINSYFSYYFLIVLLLFQIWFVVKFVMNSSYQKLLIIAYLCATELIPSVFLIGWFFK